MSKTIISLLLLMHLIPVSRPLLAENPQPSPNIGIQFFDGTWDQVLAKAKKEKRLIFLDVYATWCGPCKRLQANTFTDEEVGKYFNKHFINVKLDGEKGEGRTIAQRYGVRAYPSLYFLDHTGQVVHFTAGFRDPQRMIELGESVVGKLKEK